PRSCKLDSQLNYVDVPLAALELRRCRWVSRWRGATCRGLEQLLQTAGA
ncbi:chemotaxis protein CheW, partial [Pseudomonas sp. MAFF212428]|nr:chemotaxis protein CheW [Pseudomonas brassicae]